MLSLAQKICNRLLAPFFDIMGLYLTYEFRPLYAASDYRQADPIRDLSDVAIVLQGPIEAWNEFTLNSVLLYRRWWPAATLILSTWDDEDPAMLRTIEQTGAKIVLNKKPSNPGLKNINFQIATSYAGMLRAKAVCSKYAIKARTDQRFCSPSAAPFLIESLELFPFAGQCNQTARVGCLSLNTFKKRIYGVSDMTIFGHIDDMLRYWGCEPDARMLTVEDMPSQGDAQAYAKSRICEVYLSSHFLESIGKALLWTDEDSLNAFRDHFIIIDSAQVDLIWPKYTRRESRWKSYALEAPFDELTFSDWVRLVVRSLDRSRHNALLQ